MKRAISVLLTAVMLFCMLPLMSATTHADTSTYPPYANINYNYSDSVTRGTVRYMSQIPGDGYFNWNYWPSSAFGSYETPTWECGTASMSMALSYVGINKTPYDLLINTNGSTYFTDWGAQAHISPSLSDAISNYLNGNGDYSPVVFYIPNYVGNGHYMVIIGKISDNTYQILDPNSRNVQSATISGTSFTYTLYGSSRTETIQYVHQWYNPNPTVTLTVNFNANGGSCDTSSATVVQGAAIGNLPTPTRSGYVFDGWYTTSTEGTNVTASTPITASMTIYAHWTRLFTVNFNANGGTCDTATMTVRQGGTIANLPAAARSGYGFEGWYTAISGGILVNSTVPFTSSLTLYARWSKYLVVTLNANGGTCKTSTLSVKPGGTISSLPVPARSGYTFDGWYSSANAGNKISESAICTHDAIIYAHWSKPNVSVIYHSYYGTVLSTESTAFRGEYTLSHTYPTMSDKYFCGWAFSKGAEDYVLRPEDTVVLTENMNLYPVYVTKDEVLSGKTVPIYNINDFSTDGYYISKENYTHDISVNANHWTNWTEYSTLAAAANDTREVRTAPMYRYYYYLCPNCSLHEPYAGTSDCGATIPDSAVHFGWSSIAYKNSGQQSFSYTDKRFWTNSLGDGQVWIFDSANANDTVIGSTNSDGNVVITTGYSYRDFVQSSVTQTKTVTGYRVSTGLLGDVNGDGVINTTDALMTLRFAVNKIPKDALLVDMADVDANSTVNTTDALLILRMAVQKITTFPAQQE